MIAPDTPDAPPPGILPRPARIALALAVVAVDAVVFVIPLASLLIAYVILVNPPWVRRFLDRLGPAG